MNYLAHMVLGQVHGLDEEGVVGNFIGDAVKGRHVEREWGAAIGRGIRFHRALDATSDGLASSREARKLLRGACGKWSGVVWDVLGDQWERMFGLLAAFRDREGHANVPKRHVEDGERLGGWLGKHRTRYKARALSEAERKGRKRSALSDEEVQRLEALGVSWSGVRSSRR